MIRTAMHCESYLTLESAAVAGRPFLCHPTCKLADYGSLASRSTLLLCIEAPLRKHELKADAGSSGRFDAH